MSIWKIKYYAYARTSHTHMVYAIRGANTIIMVPHQGECHLAIIISSAPYKGEYAVALFF